MIAEHEELREIFDDDIKDLFGLRYEKKYRHKSFSPVFRRFLDAALTWNDRKKPDDFRLHLLELIQRVTFYKSHLFSVGELGGDVANTIVQQDISRAWMWTKLLARRAENDEDEPSRPILFQSPNDVEIPK